MKLCFYELLLFRKENKIVMVDKNTLDFFSLLHTTPLVIAAPRSVLSV